MKYLNELNLWINQMQKYSIWVIIIEVLCTIFISLGASQVSEFLSPWTLLIFFCAIIFTVVLVSRYSYLKYFPSSIVENIKKDFNAKTLEQDYSRITLINNSVANSLISLNSQTCQLQGEADEEIPYSPEETRLCSKGIHLGLESLLSDFLKNLHLIAVAADSKFSVGVYLNYICKDPGTEKTGLKEIFQSGSYLIKDDLQLSEFVKEELFDVNGASGSTLDLQNCLKTSYNNNKSCSSHITFNNKQFFIYCNVIPLVCSEDDPSGVMFLISDKMTQIPNDLDDVTKIHNRIVSNWVNKYNDCVNQKIQNRNQSKINKLIEDTNDIINEE